jgi:hypothetical protein
MSMKPNNILKFEAGTFSYTVKPDWLKAAEKAAEETDWVAALTQQGVKPCHDTNSNNDLVDYSVEVYEIPIGLDPEIRYGQYYVEVWDFDRALWSAVVPEIQWPLFHLTYILPIAAQANRSDLLRQIQRLTNAVIAVGRHGIPTDIDTLYGESEIDRAGRHTERNSKQ